MPNEPPIEGLLPRSVNEEIYSRSATLKVFVSSQMRTGPLATQRSRAAAAVESTAFAHAWYWERDAIAGPYCSEDECTGHAASSDGLILIVGSRITDMTEKEFRAAVANGVPCFIFVNENVTQNEHARSFVRQEQRGVNTTAKFKGRSELETQITRAIYQFAVRGWRKDFLGRQARRIGQPVQLDLRRSGQ